jgi:hypothetical protein
LNVFINVITVEHHTVIASGSSGRFENNLFDGESSAGNGAAIDCLSSGTLQVLTCEFKGCHAGGSGGAIHSVYNSLCSISDSSISSCTANYGGALVMYNTNGLSVFNLERSTVKACSDNMGGGGIFYCESSENSIVKEFKGVGLNPSR